MSVDSTCEGELSKEEVSLCAFQRVRGDCAGDSGEHEGDGIPGGPGWCLRCLKKGGKYES